MREDEACIKQWPSHCQGFRGSVQQSRVLRRKKEDVNESALRVLPVSCS